MAMAFQALPVGTVRMVARWSSTYCRWARCGGGKPGEPNEETFYPRSSCELSAFSVSAEGDQGVDGSSEQRLFLA